MNIHEKRKIVSLAFTMCIVISLAQMPIVYSAGEDVQEKAISIIEDVIGLDLSKYTVERSGYIPDRPDKYGGLLEENMKFRITSGENKIDFIFEFVNKTFWYCDIYPMSKDALLTAHYAKQIPSNTLDAAKVILQRMQTNQDESYLQQMSDALNAVTDLNSVNATIGNVKRRVFAYTETVSENMTTTSTKIEFMYSVNGADSPKVVSVSFRNGVLVSFIDGWKFFKVGDDSQKMSREEAIKIAQEQAIKEANATLKFADRPIRADFYLVPREPFTLYPFWFVELPLDYPNSTITAWQVGIWADTGEIQTNHPTGIMGGPPSSGDLATPTETSDSTTNPTPTTSPTEPSTDSEATPENSNSSELLLVIVAAVASLATLVAVAVVVRKKRTK